MSSKILMLAGDGIGPEIMDSAISVLKCLEEEFGLSTEKEFALIGGAAVDATGGPLPEETLSLAKSSDAILFGAVGGPKWDSLTRLLRPETGLLQLRSELDLFCNLRPATIFPVLATSSSLKRELVEDLDLMILRELTGGIYFGEPRGIKENEDGVRVGFNSMVYSETEIERLAITAHDIAMKRKKELCSVDKANVLDVSELWREVFEFVSKSYPEVKLTHMYVDNAAMQLVRYPKQFDVIATGNMCGDILSDLAAMMTGSIGMLPSASLNEDSKGLFEPVHGSAPDISGKNIANPLAMIMSLEMLLRYSLNLSGLADRVKKAVNNVLLQGFRTHDIKLENDVAVSTTEITSAVCKSLLEEA